MKVLRLLLPWLIVLGLVFVGWKYILPLFKAEQEEMDVQTTVVQKGDLRSIVPADGTLVPSVLVEVKSKAAGVIEELKVEPGSIVKAGDIIAELNKKEILATLRQVEADVAAAEASLSLTKRSLSPQEKASREAAVRQARIALDNAQATFDRIQDLHERGYATEQELDDAQRALDTATEQFNQAEQQLALDLEGAEPEQIAMSEASLMRQRAALDNVKEELANTTLRAPISGTVLTRPVEVGTAVSSGTQGSTGGTVICTIGDLNTMFIKANIDETDLGKIKLALPCRITFDAFIGWLWTGKVSKIYPQGQSEQGGTQFPVDITIDLASGKRDFSDGMGGGAGGRMMAMGGGGMRGGGRPGGGGGPRPAGAGSAGGAAKPDGKAAEKEGGEKAPMPQLLSQMTASAEIVLEDHPGVLILDARYVKYENGKPYCEVLPDPEDQETRERRDLTLGFSDGMRYEVIDGLKEGETVIFERPIKEENRRF